MGKDTQKQENMISPQFFPDGIKVDEESIFPMTVVATMSSGKSTMINALLGKEVLPSKNMACTALKYSILDDDQDTKEIICVTKTNGAVEVIEDNLQEELEKINQSQNVLEVFIRSHVNGVLNTDKTLLIIDTPGPNNARNISHKEVLHETLENIKGGLILYILNASQLGIEDDFELLQIVRKRMETNPELKILFVVNKIDLLDEKYDSLELCVKEAKKYVADCGFKDINIIPVSAAAALVLKKVLNQEKLTRKERIDFTRYYDIYESKDYNMKKFSITEDFQNQYEDIEVAGMKIRVGDLNQAIENTGIKLIEEYIQKNQIMSSKRSKNTIKVKMK